MPILESQQPVASTSAQLIRPEPQKRELPREAESSAKRAKGKGRAIEDLPAESGPKSAKEGFTSSEEPSDALTGVSAAAAGQSEAAQSMARAEQVRPTYTASRFAEEMASSPTSQTSLPLGALRHPFNTHNFVDNLVSAGVPRERAEIVMDAARALALREICRAEEQLVSKVAVENDAFLYSAALSELRTEIQVDVREETLAQRSTIARIHRRIESLSQTTSEQVDALKSEIKYEFQHSRDESNADFKNLELRLSDVVNRISLMFGRERAELESLRWILLRNIFLAVAGFAISAVIFNEATRERPTLPTVEAFGVRALPEDGEPADLPTPIKRVGEEEEDHTY